MQSRPHVIVIDSQIISLSAYFPMLNYVVMFWENEFVVPHPYTVAPPQATPPFNHGIDKLPGISDYDIPL